MRGGHEYCNPFTCTDVSQFWDLTRTSSASNPAQPAGPARPPPPPQGARNPASEEQTVGALGVCTARTGAASSGRPGRCPPGAPEPPLSPSVNLAPRVHAADLAQRPGSTECPSRESHQGDPHPSPVLESRDGAGPSTARGPPTPSQEAQFRPPPGGRKDFRANRREAKCPHRGVQGSGPQLRAPHHGRERALPRVSSNHGARRASALPRVGAPGQAGKRDPCHLRAEGASPGPETHGTSADTGPTGRAPALRPSDPPTPASGNV